MDANPLLHRDKAVTAKWVMVPTPDGPMPAWFVQPVYQHGQHNWVKDTPLVLLWMEIFGVNAHMQAVAERVAHAGYAVLVPFYYHRTSPLQIWPYTPAGTMAGRWHKAQTTQKGLLTDALACISYWDALPHANPNRPLVGSVGFCFGGHAAYGVATHPRIGVTVSFYGAGIGDVANPNAPVHGTANIPGHMVCLFGLQDALIPAPHREAVAQALQHHGVSHHISTYPQAGHGFFCDARADYNPEAATDAWAHMVKALARLHK
jgi:carboxymethylenebutenolidase